MRDEADVEMDEAWAMRLADLNLEMTFVSINMLKECDVQARLRFENQRRGFKKRRALSAQLLAMILIAEYDVGDSQVDGRHNVNESHERATTHRRHNESHIQPSNQADSWHRDQL